MSAEERREKEMSIMAELLDFLPEDQKQDWLRGQTMYLNFMKEIEEYLDSEDGHIVTVTMALGQCMSAVLKATSKADAKQILDGFYKTAMKLVERQP